MHVLQSVHLYPEEPVGTDIFQKGTLYVLVIAPKSNSVALGRVAISFYMRKLWISKLSTTYFQICRDPKLPKLVSILSHTDDTQGKQSYKENAKH